MLCGVAGSLPPPPFPQSNCAKLTPRLQDTKSRANRSETVFSQSENGWRQFYSSVYSQLDDKVKYHLNRHQDIVCSLL